jgi:hypothetical protein
MVALGARASSRLTVPDPIVGHGQHGRFDDGVAGVAAVMPTTTRSIDARIRMLSMTE